jgi:UDP-GlcNAc:undecaprenyl-phosphate GlcNAc-1-phosphate transferase
MNTTLIILVIIVSSLITLMVRKWFINLKKFDEINFRSVHKSKATKTGGISFFFTIFIFSLYYYLQSDKVYDFSILIPLGIMFIVGVYDDFYNADFKLKFLLQIIVAKILIDYGLVIENFHGVLGLYEIPRIPSQLFTVFVFLIIVNAINFIDGIDGLAISESIKFILIVEFISVTKTPFFYLGILTILAILPLYYFNYKKDYKVFLGDAGSLYLGTLISIYIFYVLGSEYHLKDSLKINKPLLSMSLIIYPLIDLLRVFTIRIYYKKSPFNPDQNHIHHLLLKKGLNHFIIVFAIIFTSLIFLLSVFLIS